MDIFVSRFSYCATQYNDTVRKYSVGIVFVYLSRHRYGYCLGLHQAYKLLSLHLFCCKTVCYIQSVVTMRVLRFNFRIYYSYRAQIQYSR